MAKQLKKIFTTGSDQIDQTYTVESWHVSQSVDAFTGADEYDITLSGSFTLTGSLSTTGSVNFSGLTTSSQSNVVVIDSSTGQLYYTASSAFVEFVDTGSFLVTGSVTSNTITLTKGDGSTFDLTVDTGSGGSIDTGSFVVTGSIASNVLTFTKGDSSTFDLNISPVTASLITTASVANNVITFTKGDASTFDITVDTGSGGGASPGGSDTEVQFNDGGAFGGDPNFVWNKTNNVLTLKSNIASPALQLYSALPTNAADLSLGELSFYNDTADADVGAIILKSEAAWSEGDVPTRMEFYTTPDGTETPTVKLTLKEDGQAALNSYGPGTFTGTATKWLAVTSQGDIIEETAPGGGVNSYTRPGSDTSVTYDTYLQAVGSYSVNAVGTSPAAPSSNGDVSIRYAVSNSGSNVDRIDVYKTQSGGTDNSDTLENLAVSGSITLLQVGGGSHTEVYRIISVTDETTYVRYAVEWESGDDAAISTITTDTFTFDANYTYELSAGYNRLSVVNNSNATNRLEFAPPSSANAGDEVIVEMNPEPSNTVQPAFIVRDGTPSFKQVERVWEVTGGSISQIQATGTDRVMMKFMVTVAGSIKGLMLLGAVNYIDN